MRVLVSIGGARLERLGLNPGRLSMRAEARVPGTATWYATDYQFTGLGDQTVTIQARTLPHFMGGLDAITTLLAHLRSNRPVNYIRMGRNFAASIGGLVGLKSLQVDEERLHPADGVGRIVEVQIELVLVSDTGRAFGGFL